MTASITDNMKALFLARLRQAGRDMDRATFRHLYRVIRGSGRAQDKALNQIMKENCNAHC